MDAREKIQAIFDRKNSGCAGFWTGNPHKVTWEIYLRQLGFEEHEQFFEYLNDDCRWFLADGGYRNPEGKPMFDFWSGKLPECKLKGGLFCEAESVREVDTFTWPDPDHCDFSKTIESINKFQDKAIFSGFWCPFFHQVADSFGMENYFVKMITHPEVVEAVTDHIISFYEEVNDRFFKQVGNKVDIFFFGNDFGTQLDLFISPELFKKFILPGFKRLVNVAKKYGKKVLLHSCGSVYRVIPWLIEAGVDALHPLQAKAAGMDAEYLARQYKNDLTFVGGIDTQDLLMNSTPSQIRDEVLRIRDILGPNLVISPSHEAILPNVPLRNVIAMARASKE